MILTDTTKVDAKLNNMSNIIIYPKIFTSEKIGKRENVRENLEIQ